MKFFIVYKMGDPYEPDEACYFFAKEEDAKAAVNIMIGEHEYLREPYDGRPGHIYYEVAKFNTLSDVKAEE